jgi:DNA-binding PadR family transcriptional regulator
MTLRIGTQPTIISPALSNKPMESLGDLEQIILLAVLQAGDQAYGVPVQREVRQRARRDLTLGTIYKALSRLEAKGLVVSRVGAPTSERGGRAKRYYAVTAVGKRSLRDNLFALRRMAAGLDVGLDTP